MSAGVEDVEGSCNVRLGLGMDLKRLYIKILGFIIYVLWPMNYFVL